MLIKNKNLILKPFLILIVITTIFMLSACLPPEGEQNLSSNTNSNIKKLVGNQISHKRDNTDQTDFEKFVDASVKQNSPFAEAARKNAATERNLQWLFGKNLQSGWYLYKPLIAKEIGVQLNAAPTDFAEALSRWQKSIGIQPTGVLDELTMFAFISEWQKDRLFNRGVPPDQQLLVAPPDDFYDSSRDISLRQIERGTYDAFKRMIRAAAADSSLKLKTSNGELSAAEKYLKIISSYRTREHQQRLRAASPNSGRAGLAVNSPHFTGRALDIYVGGELVSTADANRAVQINTPVYLWLVENSEKFGFRPYFYEPWHWEYVP